MADNSLLSKLKAMGPDASNGRAKEESADTIPGDDSYEEMTGDGRSSRHQVFAVQLVQANRNAQAVTYASIHSTIDYDPSRGIRFRFENDDGVFEVRIEGNSLDRVFDKLTCGKRESIRVNGNTVMAIGVRMVPKEKS